MKTLAAFFILIFLFVVAALAGRGIDLSPQKGGAVGGNTVAVNSPVIQKMLIPNTAPENDPVSLWTLQNQLLSLAEGLVGARDLTKTIYRPLFHQNGPFIMNTPTLDGAFVMLSTNSRTHWPTVVYEMAHESIHLLNPSTGYTNWLEEGVAVDFSIYAQRQYGLPVQEPKSGPYFQALQMVRSLPGGTFAAAKRIRAIHIGLGSVTFEQLQPLFSCETTLLKRLSERCVPR